uniref:Uncharacterized protein n=1 Tax=Cacopsylla melanoneura TaxID=428564 RepID=A0A8D8XMV2_9HEMI
MKKMRVKIKLLLQGFLPSNFYPCSLFDSHLLLLLTSLRLLYKDIYIIRRKTPLDIFTKNDTKQNIRCCLFNYSLFRLKSDHREIGVSHKTCNKLLPDSHL